MDGAAAAASLGVVAQVLFLDLLLSGDNALVIALACRRLPEQQARRAAWMGAAGAIGLRLILTTMAGALMALPFLQLLSALPLLVIAMNLMNGQEEEDLALRGAEEAEASIIAAVGIIILSDAAMSLDNVVALAAVSGGNFWLLMFGLAVSIPLIVFGSFGFSRLMRDYPWLADAGAAMLGWVAGGMIIGDPLLSGWVTSQAPALGVAVPLACAIFILVQGRFAREDALKASSNRPKAPIRPIPPRPQPKPAKRPMEKQAEKSAPAACETLSPLTQVVTPPREIASPPSFAAEDDAMDSGDRWMLTGLIALFAIFGLFLAVFILMPA